MIAGAANRAALERTPRTPVFFVIQIQSQKKTPEKSRSLSLRELFHFMRCEARPDYRSHFCRCTTAR